MTAALMLAACACSHARPREGDLVDGGPRAPIRAVQPCVVLRIVDGDTISCRELGSVRLIGIDSPERDQEPFGSSATAALKALVQAGETIQLERDVDMRDRYGRLLAYAWRRGRMLNWLMVRNGWAVVLTVPPNVQFVDAFVTAQRHARADRHGLWATDAFRCLPVEHRRGAC